MSRNRSKQITKCPDCEQRPANPDHPFELCDRCAIDLARQQEAERFDYYNHGQYEDPHLDLDQLM